MARITYSFEIFINKLLGNSILRNPLEIVGLFIIIALEIIIFMLAYRSYKSYKESRMTGILYWFLAFLFLFIGVMFLIVEKIAYSTIGNLALGDIMTILALITTGSAIFCFNIFSFDSTVPDYKKILSIIVVILVATYIISLSHAIITGWPNSDIVNNEPVYGLAYDIIVFLTLLPVLLTAPIVFFAFYYRNRKTDKPQALRGLWIGIGFLFFAIGYMVEAVPYFPTQLSPPLRSLNLMSALIMYICLTMPQWFKNRIGWTD